MLRPSTSQLPPLVSIQVDYDKRLANPLFSVLLTSWDWCFFSLYPWRLGKPYDFWSFQGLEKKKHWLKMGYSQTHYNTHVSFVIQQFSLGYNPDFMFILTHKITEDHLTLSDGGLRTLSSNMVVTFFELYFCVYFIQKWDLIRQKLEIATGHHP